MNRETLSTICTLAILVLLGFIGGATASLLITYEPESQQECSARMKQEGRAQDCEAKP